MAQIRTGLRKILESPIVYTTFHKIIGASYARDYLVKNYLKLEDGMRVLDIGCGPADILFHICENINYTGFDFEPAYIEKAKRNHPTNTTFYCQDLISFDFSSVEKFDRILLSEVQHHLDDQTIQKIFEVSKKLLKPDGYLVSIENVYIEGQSFIAKKLIDLDRGQNVRTVDEYLKLGDNFFNRIEYEINHHLLNIPYTHIILKYSN